MSHVRTIIIGKIQCMQGAFPSLATPLGDLQTAALAADDALTPLPSAQNKRIHKQLEEVQEYVTERCDNQANYEGEESVMEPEIEALTADCQALL